MGYPMARWLRRAGHEVTGFNRTAAKARAWAEAYGGSLAAKPDQAAANTERGCASVPA
jgi:3-hydroxyisobutyrate dehydrogenase